MGLSCIFWVLLLLTTSQMLPYAMLNAHVPLILSGFRGFADQVQREEANYERFCSERKIDDQPAQLRVRWTLSRKMLYRFSRALQRCMLTMGAYITINGPLEPLYDRGDPQKSSLLHKFSETPYFYHSLLVYPKHGVHPTPRRKYGATQYRNYPLLPRFTYTRRESLNTGRDLVQKREMLREHLRDLRPFTAPVGLVANQRRILNLSS